MEEEDTRQTLAGACAIISNWVAEFMDLSDEEDCEDEVFDAEPCLESKKEQT